jgi:hypothetical protein
MLLPWKLTVKLVKCVKLHFLAAFDEEYAVTGTTNKFRC